MPRGPLLRKHAAFDGPRDQSTTHASFVHRGRAASYLSSIKMVQVFPIVLFVAVCLSLLGSTSGGKSSDGYFYGRATFYDDNQQGACHYYSNIPDYYAAWPDTQEGFGQSCGTCWEIQCMDDNFKDGYGAYLDRSSACKDPNKKVVVKITDACPCVHANFYSNQRWCCGDENHIDLGRKAYTELADEHWGVIGLKWRQTSCDKLGVVDNSWSSASSWASSSGGSSSSPSSAGSWSSDGSSGSSASSSGSSSSGSGSSSSWSSSSSGSWSNSNSDGNLQYSSTKEWGLGALSGVLTDGSQKFQSQGWNWGSRRRLRH